MSSIHRVTKNLLSLSIAQIGSMLFGFLYTIAMARYLEAEGFGTMSFALAYAGVISVVSEMGLSQVIAREVARNNSLAERYIGNALSIKIILGVLTMIFIIGGLNLFDNYNSSSNKITVIIIGLSIIIVTFNTMFYSIYQAFERIGFQSYGQILYNSLLYLGTLIAVYFKCDIITFASLFLFASLINLVYNFIIIYSKFTIPKFKHEYLFWKGLLSESFPFAITGLSVNIFFWTDTLILSFLKGSEVVGWYNAAFRLISSLLFIPYIFNSVVFPLMSKYHILSREYLILSFQKLYKIMFLISIPLGVGTVLIADKIILLFYGSQYSPSIAIFKILIWSLVLTLIRNPFERLLEAINHQSQVTKIFIIGAIINVVFNIALIPKYSYLGASTATLITSILVLILLATAAKHYGVFISKNEIKVMIKILISSAVMGTFLILPLVSSLLVQISVSVIIYFVTLEILKIFTDDEKMLIKSIILKLKHRSNEDKIEKSTLY